jgi:hypothetical protein
MTILKGDVKLVKSQVMDDVPEGGGAPTSNEVVDGSSNAIFPDVSETDRAAGRVSARKVHVWVQSDDTDTYLGGNVIVAEPPNDPNVAVTIFSGLDTFDLRADAISRIEAYLSVGPNYAGYLYSNHIEGMAALAIIQRTDALPAIGSTLALTKREGFSDQFVQYVRVTAASAVLTTFTDTAGDFQRYVLTLTLSDPLRADFPGFDAARIDPTKAQLAAATKASTTIVANAAKYGGVVPLEEAASIGDFSVKATGIFTQLVPSAQIETPIGDARTNQVLTGVVGSGTAVVQGVTLGFTTSQNLFIGGGIAPKTLSINNGDVTLTDSGGRLMNAGTQVGTVDYDNGILSLLTNLFGTGSLTFTVTYQPASSPAAVTQSQGFKVKIETRSISYARTIQPSPVPGTLSISYLVAGRWYVISDDGSGAIRGPDSGYGSGTVNPTTGTVLVTLGALPDVGSQIIYQWVEPDAARTSELLTLDNDGNLYWPFNTSGDSSLETGAKSIVPGELTITWTDDSAILRTVTDDGAGNLTGYGTGPVDYAKGVFRLSPSVIPAPGTTIHVSTGTAELSSATVTIASGSGSFGVTDIAPGSVDLTVTGQLRGKYLATATVDWGAPALYRITDDGAGVLNLVLLNTLLAVGTIDYAAGTFALNANTVIPTPLALLLTAWDNVYLLKDKPNWAVETTT